MPPFLLAGGDPSYDADRPRIPDLTVPPRRRQDISPCRRTMEGGKEQHEARRLRTPKARAT